MYPSITPISHSHHFSTDKRPALTESQGYKHSVQYHVLMPEMAHWRQKFTSVEDITKTHFSSNLLCPGLEGSNTLPPLPLANVLLQSYNNTLFSTSIQQLNCSAFTTFQPTNKQHNPSAKMSVTFSPAQQKLLILAFQCFDAPPKVRPSHAYHFHLLVMRRELTFHTQIDTKKLAELMGFKTAATANARWSEVKKKITEGGANGDGGGEQGEAATADAAAGGEDKAEVSPTKAKGKGKGGAKGKKRKADETEEVSTPLPVDHAVDIVY